MKKWGIFPVLLALLLTGCRVDVTAPTIPSDGEIQTMLPTEEGLYAPGTAVEQQTGGAVRLYPLEKGVYDGLVPMGENLLLLCGGSHSRLELLTGDNLVPVVETGLSNTIASHGGGIQVGSDGVAYLDESNRALVFLNASLRETSRLQLPKDIIGAAWLSPDWKVVYYCTRSGIQMLDLDTGISRLLTEQHGRWQSVTGVLFEGYVLRCEVELEDGTREIRLIDSETGEILWEDAALSGLVTAGEGWYLTMENGAVQEHLLGRRDAVQNLWPADTEGTVFPLLESQMLVTSVEEDGGCRLDAYDLKTGQRYSAVQIPGLNGIRSICAESKGGGIWFLANDISNGAAVIGHWESGKSPVQDSADYLSPHYTRENPDISGLQILREEVSRLEEAYGVKFLLGEDPAGVATDHYDLETEYLVQSYQTFLPMLEKAMSHFPDGFFLRLAERTDSGVLYIGLVRSISGVPEMKTLSQPGIQYWLEEDAYLMLSLGESLEQSFYHAISHAIETRVLSVCTAFYDWGKLNPQGFTYDNDYIKNLDRDNSLYLGYEDRAFIDRFSMSFAKEDRARVMEFACMPGNGDFFSNQTMQRKLKMLCDGIRQAFSLEETKEIFLWEQYLSSDFSSQ